MKILVELLKECKIRQIIGDSKLAVSGIAFDSRKVEKGNLFVAVPGTSVDGHEYIGQAIVNGASCVICEKLPEEKNPEVVYVLAENSSRALGIIASEFFDNPSRELKLTGITGTNGKTTTVTLLYRLFTKLGEKAGLISTVTNFVDDEAYDSTHTTPDPVEINRLLRKMADKGCGFAFMEVSSHALVQERVAGLHFAGGIFSNITHDHLDYHKTFDEYLRAKKQFFDHLNPESFVLINADDRNGKYMVQNTPAKVYFYAVKTLADFHAKIIESHFDGMMLSMDNTEVWVKLIGEFNAYNLLAVYACATILGKSKVEVLKILSQLETVDGRFEYLRSNNGIIAIVDYAHTPDALLNVLSTINQIRTGNEQLITVVGAGGNRDKTKRPKMASVAAESSNKVILTSDNPRFEEPRTIIEDMEQGIEEPYRRDYVVIADRKEAIRTACMMAKPGDIILVAGKGHETYQEIKGVKHHFNDKEIIAEQFMLNKTNLQ